MEYKIGNKKLGRDTAVINMNSATDCPSEKLNLCAVCKICYAKKPEKQYPSVLPYRRRQERDFDNQSANQINFTIKKHKKVRYLRFSESGDFKNQAAVNKMSAISDLMDKRNIKVYGYTARKDLDFSNISANMAVNGSGFMVSNNFYPVDKFSSSDKYRCLGDCRKCNICKTPHNINIAVEKH